MPNSNDDVLINFVGDVSGLAPVDDALEAILVKEGQVGEAWKKTSAAIDAQNKTNVAGTNKLSKSIQDLATATKSMDKAVIGGAYASYLKQIQAQLGLTNKELVNYIQNARKAAQEAIFSAKTDQEIDEITLSIEAMNEQLKMLAAAEQFTGDKTQSLKARLREAKEELIAMADAGLQGTPAFEALQQKAGELDHQMRDLNTIIKNTGSNTQNIEGLVSIAGAVAGGFAIAQGAAALFGNENEDVQKALLKVNAAMSFLQGIQQVENFLQKESIGLLLLKKLFLREVAVATGENTIATEANVVAQEAQSVATIEATESQVALNTAMELNPAAVVVAAVLALAAAVAYLATNNNDAAEEQGKLNDALERATTYLDLDITAMQKQAAIQQALAKQRGASATEIASLIGKESLLELKRIDDARVAAAKAYNEAKDNDETTIEDKKKLYDRIYELQKQYYEKSKDIQVAAIEFQNQRDADALKSFTAFQQAKVAATIAGSDNEKIAQINAIREIAKQREFSAEFNSLTDGEKAQKRAEDEKQIQGLQLANYQHYLKGRTALEDSYVAESKLILLKNQADSIASITAVTDAEIAALKRRREEALRSDPNLNSGETRKIIAETNLQIAELEREKQLKLLEIQKSAISDRLAAVEKGTEAEYNLRLQAITNEQQVALAAAEITAEQISAINAKFDKQREIASRDYQEVLLQNQISLDNALLDQFGITEKEKLEITLRRLNEQQQLEISQADNNGAKIQEINAKFEKQKIEANKATNAAILAENLRTLDVYNEIANRRNNATINNPAVSATTKQIAADNLLKDAQLKTDLQRSALEKEKKLIDVHEYEVKLQEIRNQEDADNEEHSKTSLKIFADEQQKKLAIFQRTISIIQAGIDQLDTSGLKTGLTEVLGLYNKIGEAIVAGKVARAAADKEQDPKVKADLLKAAELEERSAIVSSSIGAIQNTLNQVFADQQAKRQQELADNLQALEDQKAKELENKKLTEEQKAEIDKKYKEKEKQEKLKAFEADKQAKKQQAVINGFLAVTNALATAPNIIAGLLLAVAVAAQTAIQVGNINKEKPPKFRHGKIDIQGPGTTTSDSIPSMISRGESVINADATAKWKDALEAINTNKFEHYITNKLSDFIFPQVPEHIKPSGGGHIDYSRLAKEIAAEMKGIIPAPAQVHNTIDGSGLHSFMTEGNSRTEQKNKRYRTS